MDKERPKITNLEGREADKQRNSKKRSEDSGGTKQDAKEKF